MEGFKMSSLLLNTDVTAVKLHHQHILAGIGSHINLFSTLDFRLLQRKQVLNGQKIYGIVPFRDKLKFLIFGGKQFTVVHVNKEDQGNGYVNQLFGSILCNDWIQGAIWQSYNEILLLTAHNVVQVWDINKKQLKSQHASRNNSILYSGLLVAIDEEILVFAGTVFSEVLIHSVFNDEQLHSLTGHKGVIFSIACDIEKELIVTTSDDRSVHVWTPNNLVDFPKTSINYWKNITIICKFKVYGHLSRVMRCLISDDFIISAGEDSAVCFWNFEGNLINKFNSHQNGCIWTIDINKTHLITGGGDGGLKIHPLKCVNESRESNTITTENFVKSLVFTAKGNIVLLCDNNDVIYYNINKKTETLVCRLKLDSSFKLLSISSCKQIMSVVDMCGNLNIFIENCKYDVLNRIFSLKLEVDNVLSMHWAGNRFLVLCCGSLIIVLEANSFKSQIFANFILPHSKERWLTAAAVDETLTMFVFSDRCGNLHFYNRNELNPIKTFRKVHGRYGATSITIKKYNVITTGRDGSIKYFSFDGIIKQTYTINLNFQWAEKFIDKDENLVCGFQERLFCVYDIRNCSNILEVPCGGGHRNWDVTRYFCNVNGVFEEFIKLIYIKKSQIHEETFRLNHIVPKNLINGGHIKEINCFGVYDLECNRNIKVIISGSEDTTLRISTLDIRDMKCKAEMMFKHLSSIKCLKVFKLESDKVLLITGGGRAQICIKLLKFKNKGENEILIELENIFDYMIKGGDKQRKEDIKKSNALDFDPETRIMDVDIVKADNNIYTIVAGSSDSFLRIFKLNLKESNSTFNMIDCVKYHETCIIKTQAFNYKDNSLLATTSTKGELVIWDFNHERNHPIFCTKTNKSGINGVSIKIVDDSILIATSGDDNSVHLIRLIKNVEDLKIIGKWNTDTYHSSMVSGVLLVSPNYLISVSIDQRITLSKWKMVDGKIVNDFVTQVYSDVADIHGAEIIDSHIDYVLICVYGAGMEVVKIPLAS